MGPSYLIRYGLMGQVGRFAADANAAFEWGQPVVVRSHRGTELGEVLSQTPEGPPGDTPPAGNARVVRAAGPDDLERVRRLAAEREVRFAACQRVFQDGLWPIDLIDVEPLLDDGRTVLYYLGLHRLDVAGILAAFRASTDLDVMLEPVGRDLAEDEADPAGPPDDDHDHGCGSCGSEGGGCGSGGGGCGSTGDGCSSCGVKKLLSSRR